MDDGLLSGVLAVQLGIATPTQVIAAASAHVADRSRSIADRLHSDGVLDDKQREMLESLTANALRVHGGDPRKTLQSLGGDRAVLRSFGGSIVLDQKGGVSVVSSANNSTESLGDRTEVSSEQPGRYSYSGNRDDAELGRGGIGRVLIAHDEHIGRDVAIKELLGGNGARASTPSDGITKTTAIAARFLREARVTGQLEHPNIVPVYEVGQREDGTYYYAMRLVRGRTLSEALTSCHSLQERLKLLPQYVSLCNAVGFAHSRGVIHRDIKPDNVMLGAFGETVVLDWGLAKVRGKKDIRGREIEGDLKLLQDAATGQTMDGSAIGTPAYMSPEQADGQIDEIDERSDVWSLGAVLYELLSGRPPFEGVTPFEIIGKVLREPVKSPREREPRVPAELAAVALKALSREPSQRYATARELAAEIESFMSGERIGAYEYSAWELLLGFARKNRAATVAALVVLVTLMTSAAGLAVAYRDAASARDRAERNEREAKVRETEAHMNLAATFAEKAERLLEDRRYGSARVLAAASLLHNPASVLGPFHDAAFAAKHPLCETVLTSGASIAYQADKSLVARPRASFKVGITHLHYLRDSTQVVGLGSQGSIVFVDTADGTNLASHPAKQGKYVACDVSADGATVAAVTSSGAIQILDAKTRRPTASLAGPSRQPTSIRFSRVAPLVVVTSSDGNTDVWDLTASKLLTTLYDSNTKLRDAVFGEDGNTLATVNGDGMIRSWDFKTGKQKAEREGHLSVVTSIDLSPDGAKLATAGYDGTVRVWNAEDLSRVAEIPVIKQQLNLVRFTPDGKLVLAVGDDRSVAAFDTVAWSRVATLDGLEGSPKSFALSKDGKTLAIAMRDTLTTWDFALASPVLSLRSSPFNLYRLAVSNDGRRVAAGCSRRRAVDVWDAQTSALLASLPATGAIFDVAFSPNGKRLYGVSSEAATVDMWELESEKHVSMPASVPARGLAVSPDGKYVGIGRHTGMEIRDADTLAIVHRLEGRAAVAFSPDGKTVATSKERRILLYGLPSGEPLGEVGELPDGASDLRFSHDGRWLAMAGYDAHLVIVDVAARKVAFELVGHKLWVNTVRFSPDDALLGSASDDGTVRIWSMNTRSTVSILSNFGAANAIDFLPDGKSIAFDDLTQIRIFPVDFSLREANPKELFERAQDEMKVELRGTELVPRR